MDKYRILKSYSPVEDQWGYALQREFATKRWFKKPLTEWEDIGWSGVYTPHWDLALKWHRMYNADIYEKNPATGEIKAIYSEPQRLCAEGLPKPFSRYVP